jgi:hypothetical protein
MRGNERSGLVRSGVEWSGESRSLAARRGVERSGA